MYSVLGTVYCGGNGAHIQDTVLVGTALWSVYSVYCVLWWEWGPHTGHHAGGDALWSVYSVLGTVYCGGNGAHIQDTVLVGTALWSVYSVYCVLWWEWGPHTGHHAGGDALWSVYSVLGTVYCGGNRAHIQDTVLVGTALWSVYSVYCVLWWEWGPHTGHHAGGDGLVVCVQCVRYCVLRWEWGPHTGHHAGGDGLVVGVQCVLCTVVGMGPTYRTPCWWGRLVVGVQCVRYCVLWSEWGPHTGHRAGGDSLVVCVQCVLCTVVGMGPTYRTPCWWGRPCGLCTVCTVYCGGNGAHIQDTMLVGTALWSVYSVLGTVVGMGPTYRTPCWWGRPCGLCTVCTVYCGGNGAHIQDTVLVGTALWSVYSVYCELWWEWGPHTGHRDYCANPNPYISLVFGLLTLTRSLGFHCLKKAVSLSSDQRNIHRCFARSGLGKGEALQRIKKLPTPS